MTANTISGLGLAWGSGARHQATPAAPIASPTLPAT